MNRWHDRQVLECGSPLPLWRSWIIESARGLAQSKTLTRHWGRFMALMRVHCWRSEIPMNRTAPERPQTTEITVAGIITLAAIILHGLFLACAGALWRDEAGGVALATVSSFGEFWNSLTHDSFPALFPLIVRAWGGIGLGTNDFTLRLLGVLTGLCLLAVLWRSARAFDCRSPLIALALVGTNAAIVQWGDSLRGYGLGSALAALCLAEVWSLVRQPTLRQFAVASGIGVLSVNCLYQNAFLLLAASLSAAIVCLRRKRSRTAWLALAAGLPAAISLLPYLRPLVAAQQWWIVEKTGFKTALAGDTLSDAMSTPPILGILVWIVAVFATCGMGISRLGRRAPDRGGDFREDAGLFAGLAAIIGTVGFLIFVANAGLPTQPWYWISWLTFMAVCCQGAFGRRLGRYGRRGILAAGGLAALSAISAVWPVTARMTNMNSVAEHLRQHSGPNDLIIVYPWYCGISFERYYQGNTPWRTLPDIADHRFHRYDLLKVRLQEADALRPVHEEIRSRLRAGNRIWMVGALPPAVAGERAPRLPPAPEAPSRWFDEPYTYAWGRQTAELLQETAGTLEKVPLPSRHSRRYEVVRLAVTPER
jgi:hypothetical protein